MEIKSNASCFIVFVFAGILLLTCSFFDLFPSVFLAEIFSSDQALSIPYTTLLKRSQWTLAWLVLCASPLVFVFSFLIRRIHHAMDISDCRFYSIISTVTFLLTFAVQLFLFDNIPHVSDAIVHLFQSKIFASGHLSAPAPPCYNAFHFPYMIISINGIWRSIYPPGHALTLLPFLKMNILPFFGATANTASSLCLIYIAHALTNRKITRIFALLLTASPLFLLLGASYMSHISSTFYLSAPVALALYAMRHNRLNPLSAVALISCGFLSGMAILTRPQDIVLLSPTLFVISILFLERTSAQSRVLQMIYFALGIATPFGIFLGWNAVMNGHPFSIGYGANYDDALIPSFRPKMIFDVQSLRERAPSVTLWTLLRFNKAMLGWPSSLLFIPFAFLDKRKFKQNLFLLTQSILVILFFHFYDYYGAEYEARFLILILPHMLLLTSEGINQLGCRSKSLIRFPLIQPCLLLTLLICFGHALCYYWPVYLIPKYSGSYESTTPKINQYVHARFSQKSIVLIESTDRNPACYSSGFLFNDPYLTNDIIYARNVDVPCLQQNYPDREFFLCLINAEGETESFSQALFSQSFPKDSK